MKKSRHFLTVLMALGLLAFGAGCSSDDSGSGEGSDYTPEIPEGGAALALEQAEIPQEIKQLA